MLSGRMPELQYLNQHFDKDGSQILVVYGQKHIGKTALAREFAQDKPSFYYLAKPCSEREQRYQLNLQLKADRIIDESEDRKFPEFSYIFDAICGSEVMSLIHI
ncbi:MAG: ATP-binding protein [Lachnospiraceae bacterium]|nr:ATP-binding protein [Lachnospiraceae bacterium]